MEASIQTAVEPAGRAEYIRSQMPAQGLFAGQEWRVSPGAFPLPPGLAAELQTLGRVLLQFYRAANLLYRKSVEGSMPGWVAEWLDLGKPESLVQLQRAATFKTDLPQVIRPDLLLTDKGFSITELDSVPGGIGLTAWLNLVYTNIGENPIGGRDGMIRGFRRMFGDAARVHIVVSEEAATYRPEMEWLVSQLNDDRFAVRDAHYTDFAPGDAVYRFFELFDTANVPNSGKIFDLASRREIKVTSAPKAFLEEKMLFALFWNRHLREFWRRELGEAFLRRLEKMIPYAWVVDPAPLPPQGAIPRLNLTDWQQLKELSQKERDLILKVSGFSPQAWGARGVYLGSDLSHADWAAAVDQALARFKTEPYILQEYERPALVDAEWCPPLSPTIRMQGRARICPYYFVTGGGDAARTELGGVLATICPADKKIIHGMTDAILAPCSAAPPDDSKSTA